MTPSEAYLLVFVLISFFEVGVGITVNFPVQWSERAGPVFYMWWLLWDFNTLETKKGKGDHD